MGITITHAERAAWQRRAANLLGRLLTTFPSLPVITWTIGQAGSSLVGHCCANDQAARRADFATWCAVLGATPRPDHASDGVMQLRAFIDDLDGVHVHLIADVFEAGGEEATHGTQ